MRRYFGETDAPAQAILTCPSYGCHATNIRVGKEIFPDAADERSYYFGKCWNCGTQITVVNADRTEKDQREWSDRYFTTRDYLEKALAKLHPDLELAKEIDEYLHPYKVASA